MFFFGSSENTRELYLANAMALRGPDLPSTSFEELDAQGQKNLFAYVYIAYSDALDDEISDEGLREIRELYDETFLKMAKAHPDFREAVNAGRHVYLPDYNADTIEKYQAMARSSQHS